MFLRRSFTRLLQVGSLQVTLLLNQAGLKKQP